MVVGRDENAYLRQDTKPARGVSCSEDEADGDDESVTEHVRESGGVIGMVSSTMESRASIVFVQKNLRVRVARLPILDVCPVPLVHSRVVHGEGGKGGYRSRGYSCPFGR